MQPDGNTDTPASDYVGEAASAATGHLMRVRVRKPVWAKLREIAEIESERCGMHITASDIVRSAIGQHLGLHESIEELRNMPPSEIGNETLVFDSAG